MSDKHGEVLIDKLDVERLTKDISIVKTSKEELLKISNTICKEYTGYLDSFMEKFYVELKEGDVDDRSLELKFLELSNLVYFLGDRMESLGIESTVASSRNQEIYNRLYQEAAGTIKDKQSLAEEGTRYEYLLKSVYDSIYKRIKLKMDAAYEMISTCKNVMKSRISQRTMTNRMDNIPKPKAAYED